MIRLLCRVIFFVIGALLLLDAILPTLKETARVDGHDIRTSVNRTGGPGYHPATNTVTTNYELMFVSGAVRSCTVGYQAYNSLEDGDTISVEATRVFKSCIKVDHENHIVYQSAQYRKMISILLGLFLIAVSIWWKEGDGTISISL